MTHAPVIGILSGMGPRSTAPFLEAVYDVCRETYGARHDVDFPKILLCSQPAPFYEDRPNDDAALEAATLEGLRTLERGGASFIAMACNTVHMYYGALAAQLSVPLLNIVELAADALPAGAAVALVAARDTAESGLYQRRLEGRGLRVVDAGHQADVDHLLTTARDTTDVAALRAAWSPVTQKAEAAGAGVLLVACTDLSAVLAHASTALPVVDAADVLARAIVRRWRESQR